MELIELKEEEMYAIVAPDGHIQLSTIAPDFASCVGVCQLFFSHGLGKSLEEMIDDGAQILPIKISVVQNGTQEEGFERAKEEVLNLFRK